MTATPKTRIPEKARAHIADSMERLIESEGIRLQSQGLYPKSAAGLRLARLEVALTIGAMDVVEHAVAIARANGATWDDIAKVAGLSSRGSAARRFGSPRGSENETSAHRAIRKLQRAKRAKNDDFRTRLVDVEAELAHYPEAFRGRSVLLPCDDLESAFWDYFDANFDRLGLTSLTAVQYAPQTQTTVKVKTSDGVTRTRLNANGSFRSDEVQSLIAAADIVVTNPPFSAFREFVTNLVEHDRKFLILGGMNSVTNNGVWSLIRDGRMWLGATANGGSLPFLVPEGYHGSNLRFDEQGRRWVGVGVRWFTNLDLDRRHVALPLSAEYSAEKYPRYDNYPAAIEVGKVADIPKGYDGEMGVPVTFLGRHDPAQFEIVGFSRELVRENSFRVAGRALYDRIVIRHAVSESEPATNS